MSKWWEAIVDFIIEWWWDILVVLFLFGSAWLLWELLMKALDTL